MNIISPENPCLANQRKITVAAVASLNILFFISFGPLALFYFLAVITILFSYQYLIGSEPVILKYLVILLLVSLLLVSRFFQADAYIDINSIEFIGAKFYLLSAIAFVLKHKKTDQKFDILSMIYQIGYFPVLFCGPILSLRFSSQSVNNRNIKIIILHFCTGLLKIFVVANSLEIYTVYFGNFEMDLLSSYIISLICLGYYFATLSGITEISRGVSGLMGNPLPKTFILPYLADSPQNFWERWNNSIPKWVNDYVYMPLLIKFKKPYLVIFISYLCISLWHEVTLKYICWGISWAVLTIIWTKFRKLPLLLKRILFLNSFLIISIVLEAVFAKGQVSASWGAGSASLLYGLLILGILVIDDMINYYLENISRKQNISNNISLYVLMYTIVCIVLLVSLGVVKSPIIFYAL